MPSRQTFPEKSEAGEYIRVAAISSIAIKNKFGKRR
jgi:hypothetical protein